MNRKDLEYITHQLHTIYTKLDYDVVYDIMLSQTLIQLSVAVEDTESVATYERNLEMMRENSHGWSEHNEIKIE